jgi:hypothetical protein
VNCRRQRAAQQHRRATVWPKRFAAARAQKTLRASITLK